MQDNANRFSRADPAGLRREANRLIDLAAEWHGITLQPDGSVQLPAWSSGALGEISTAHHLLESDPGGLSTILQLSHFLAESISEARVPLRELLAPTGTHDGRLALVREFDRISQLAEVRQARDAFHGRLADAAAYYAPDRREELLEYLSDGCNAVKLRVAALESVRQGLMPVQLREGEPSGQTPKLMRHVFVCHSNAELVKALPALPSSIGMVMFLSRDRRREHQVHFGLWIVDGKRVFLFRDLAPGPHPLAAGMTRRPGKRLAERMERNLFPYELQDRVVGANAETGKSLRLDQASTSRDLYPLVPLAELDPDSLLWTALVIDLLKARVFDEGFACPRLSHVSSAIRVGPAEGLLSATAAQLPVPADMAGTARQLTSEDLRSARAARALAGGSRSGHNDWLLDLLGHRINEDLIDVAPTYGALPALGKVATARPGPVDDSCPAGDGVEEYTNLPITAAGLAVLRCGDELVLAEPADSSFDVIHAAGQAFKIVEHLAVHDPDAIGTAAELEADRYFLARANQASQLNHVLLAEWEQQDSAVLGFLQARANSLYRKWLERDLPAGQRLLTTHVGVRQLDLGVSFPPGLLSMTDNVLRVKPAWVMKSGRGTRRYREWSILLSGWRWDNVVPLGLPTERAFFDKHGRGPRCALADRPAAVAVAWEINNWEGLCELLELTESDLPPLLRRWSAADHYVCNSILDRHDPMDSRIRHPLKRPIKFALALSKPSFKHLAGASFDSYQPPRFERGREAALINHAPGWVRRLLRDQGYQLTIRKEDRT